jgi:peptide/nickel transport system substrate-binding protein
MKATISLAMFALLCAVRCVQAGETEAGTPREDMLIIDAQYPSIPNPDQLNPFQEGVDTEQGLKQLAIGALWEIDTITGKQFPALAATNLEPLDGTYTKFSFKTREDVKWSDGEDFSAEDVVFTAKMLMDSLLPAGHYLNTLIKNIRKVDGSTVEIETKAPSPHLQEQLGVVIAGTALMIMPAHIWKDKNVATYSNSDPVMTGPYTLKRADPHGDWVLWERRADWDKSDVGKLYGKPRPRYVLYRSYGSEEERVAAIKRNDLDIAMPLSQTAFEEAAAQNRYVKGWSDKFPWGNMDDPCDQGIHFNDSRYPFNNPTVRWALALAIDIDAASLATLSGALRVAALGAPPTTVLTRAYYEPMQEWLIRGFTLPDSFKPFDPGYAARMTQKLRGKGVQGLPSDPAGMRALFGIGWWKHDPDEATRLLESAGFKKIGGQWQIPKEDKTGWLPWKIRMNIPDGFAVLQEHLGVSVAEQWNKFGIDVSQQRLDYSRFVTAFAAGTFDAGPYWSGACAIGPNLFTELAYWHSRYRRPTGEQSQYNRDRLNDRNVDEAIEDIVNHPPDDPRQVEYGRTLLQQMVVAMPAIQMFGTTQFVPVNTYYWTNEPSAADPYEGPWWRWSTFKFMLPKFRQALRGALNS